MERKIDVNKSEIFNDLVEYSQLPRELVLRRCEYAATELAILWRKKTSVIDYYTSTDLYIFDLTKYQLILESGNLIDQMINQIKERKLNKILEFGGGIGQFSILCDKNNLKVTYYDLDGKTKEYASWRFKKNNCSKITIKNEDPLNERWDCVNVMDVLEHLENPNEIILKLKDNAKFIFCNPDEVNYNIFFPQHISKFNLNEYFELVQGYLWKNKSIH
tara:strand:+ start:154 stop:807 length:654 start_codon:yes stop_codon:yes gene_type:complete